MGTDSGNVNAVLSARVGITVAATNSLYHHQYLFVQPNPMAELLASPHPDMLALVRERLHPCIPHCSAS